MAEETVVAPVAPVTPATPAAPVETVQSITKSATTPETKSTTVAKEPVKQTQPVTQPTTVTQPVTEPTQPTQARDQTGKFTPSDPRGFDLLDASEFAPDIWAKIEPRLKRYHRQVKQADKNFQSLVAHNQALEKRLMEVAGPQEFATIQNQYSQMEQQAQQAASQGDWITYGRLQRDLTQLEAQAQNFQPKPVEVAQPPHPFDAEETAAITKWQQTREWAQTGHPMFGFVSDIGAKLFQDPGWKQRDTEEVLQEIDRIMNAVMNRQSPPQQQPIPQQQVLTNQQRVANTTPNKLQLNGGQKMVAERMFMRNGLAKTRDEAHELYRKQLELI